MKMRMLGKNGYQHRMTSSDDRVIRKILNVGSGSNDVSTYVMELDREDGNDGGSYPNVWSEVVWVWI